MRARRSSGSHSVRGSGTNWLRNFGRLPKSGRTWHSFKKVLAARIWFSSCKAMPSVAVTTPSGRSCGSGRKTSAPSSLKLRMVCFFWRTTLSASPRHFGESGGVMQRYVARKRHHLAGGYGDELRVTPARQQSADLLPNRPLGDSVTDPGDGSGHLES